MQGHELILTALTSFATFAGERTRFQGIMLDLARSRRENEFEVELKTQIMALINALLKFGAGAETLEFRLHLRFEFLMLGIIPLIEKLKQYENHNLISDNQQSKVNNMIYINVNNTMKFFKTKHKK